MKEKMMELVGNTLFVNILRSGDRVDYGKLNPFTRNIQTPNLSMGPTF